MSTYTIYPEVDGWAEAFSSNQYFSDLVAADGTNSSESGGMAFRIESHSVLDEYNYIRRGLGYYDTSVIESTEAPYDALVSMVLDSKVNEWSFDPYLGIYNHVGSQETTIVNADYQRCTDTILISPIIALSSMTAGGRVAWTWSATLSKLQLINKEGYTTICLREVSHDANDSAPTWENNKNMQAIFRGVEYTGTTSDPYLQVFTTASPLNAGVKVGDQIYGLLTAHVNVGDVWYEVTLGDVNVADTWYDIL